MHDGPPHCDKQIKYNVIIWWHFLFVKVKNLNNCKGEEIIIVRGGLSSDQIKEVRIVQVLNQIF